MRDLSVEKKWQARWAEQGAFHASEPGDHPYYCLEMLPYPSGRLHMGHVRNYSIGDAMARFHRMRGRSVVYPIGWDAFGLPAENAAIHHGEDPAKWTRRNIASMRSQLQRLGFSYDWTREIASCEPEFYRWNQWFFLKMLERGLAYRAHKPLNWCDSCETVLANEQVVNGRCWRCDGAVRKREFDQWFLRTTDYADELLDELDNLTEWPDEVRTMQRNWIGRSHGAQFLFEVEGCDDKIEIFTTRPDTVFGVSFMALAVEHPLIATLLEENPKRQEIQAFVDEQQARSVEDRFAEGAVKLGVDTGRFALNPFSGERVPIWVANFVLMDVGTGAIMGVPGHDQRDFEFARAFDCPVRPVIRPADGEAPDPATMTEAAPGAGVLHESGPYSGLPCDEAQQKIVADAESRGFGAAMTTFRLKDWGISRQRYWGTPIPVIYCDACGVIGVPEDQLPVQLPLGIELTGSGGSPLDHVESFVKADCPKCGGPGRRETDTMDTFVDSSWYYFRYLDPKNDEAPFRSELADAWTPVNLYIGGIEHATMHLIYTRFWTKMMRDLGMLKIDEPVRRLFTQGMVIKDGAKMSKSKGNVVDPDEMIERYGADTTRLFCLFAAPPEKKLDWSESGVEGCHRFLGRIWRTWEGCRERLSDVSGPAPAAPGDAALSLRRRTHRTIQRVTVDLDERMRMNTAVSAIMELINETTPLSENDPLDLDDAWAVREAFDTIARLLVPFAPHFAEELWSELGGEGFAAHARWPEADPAMLIEDEVTVAVQVSGKMRGKLQLPAGTSQELALEAARAEARVASHLEGKTVRRVIWVPDKLLNVVVG